jgi:hypothetical protein
MSPRRIQRRRTKGWRMPEGAVYVGRGSAWGNKYRLGANPWYGEFVTIRDGETLVKLFQNYAEPLAVAKPGWLAPLRGKDLVCWCPLDQPCHADVLLELANQ